MRSPENTDEIRRLFDRGIREHARPDGPGVRVERAGPVVRQVGGPDDWNGVVWSDPGLDARGADAAVAAQIAHCTALGLPEFEWKLYAHDRPADLGERLRAAGFVPEEPEALLVAPAGPSAGAVGLPEGVSLRPVTDAAGAELMARAHERAFGTDGSRLLHQVVRRLEEAPEDFVAVLAVDADGEPVCSGRMELYPGTGFAGLWGGGTVAAWRGRGVYRALVAYRARIAVQRGYRYLQVDATALSAPILRRLGFLELGTTTPYVYRPGR
ncbi:GNAT family N-acetyltransferase [Streptomyces sp. NPDC012600]|uniref:GNAT family N-acetyltransferase n=1 Tax=Streptomyces stephensoniae TaxID=3375367 RepID=A0ABU2VZR1_9ACTN|nr:GNAT family N-acetyltransferase [Streptomyces griseus]MDT0491090.1 GNAT family N-acetyltransferase [Streptomyces griseus]